MIEVFRLKNKFRMIGIQESKRMWAVGLIALKNELENTISL